MKKIGCNLDKHKTKQEGPNMRATHTDAIILHPKRVEIMEEELRRLRAAEAAARENELRAAVGRNKPNALPSPFRIFLQDLLNRHGRVTTTNAGHARWHSFPIQEALASGLWIVLLKTAQKIGRPLDTKTDTVGDIAPRVDRMVNVGMLLIYGDPHAAAEAFEQTVIRSVHATVAALPAGQAVPLQEILQLPAAKFFANLIREATTYRKHLQAAIGMLRAGNIHSSGLRVLDEIGTRAAETYVDRLRLDDPEPVWEPSSWEDLVQELDVLKKSIQTQRILLKMPARQTGTQVQLDTENSLPLTIQTHWLKTELLLAAANLPNHGFIDVIGEYRRCVTAIRRVPETTVIKRFFRRLSASGVNISDKEREVLTETIGFYVASLKSLPKKFPLDDQPPAIIYRLDHMDPRLDSRLALALALYNIRPNTQEEASESESIGRFWASKIEWPKINATSVRAMLSNGIVPTDEVARGISLMRRSERRPALKHLMASFDRKIDAKILDILTGSGLVKISPIFISNNLPRLPRHVVAEALPKTIHRSRDRSDPYVQRLDMERLILRMVNCLSAKQAREVLEDSELRQDMVSIMLEAFWDDASRTKHRISDRKFKKFLDKIGSDLWCRYVLSVEISLRQSTYQATPQEIIKDDLFLPPWEDMEDDGEHWFKPSEFMGLDQDKTRTLLRTRYTEDRMFLWLYAAHDRPRKMLANYHRTRKHYFIMLKSIPRTKRTKS